MESNFAARAFRIGFFANVAAILILCGIGLWIGRSGSPTLDLSAVGARLNHAQAEAATQSWWMARHNIGVSLRLLATQVVPVFGLLISSLNLGLPLGTLIKSMTVNSNMPLMGALAMTLTHGIPEYLGFALMQNSVTSIHISAFFRLRGRSVSWGKVFWYSSLSFASGLIILIAAAVIEGYVTPFISGRLLRI